MYKYSIINKKIDSWENAIRESLNCYVNEFFNKNYIEDCIHNVKKLGPYIVVVPGIAMPHARPKLNVIKECVVISKFKYEFDMLGRKVNILITLVPKETKNHMEIIKNISQILLENNNIERLLRSKNIEDLKFIFRR